MYVTDGEPLEDAASVVGAALQLVDAHDDALSEPDQTPLTVTDAHELALAAADDGTGVTVTDGDPLGDAASVVGAALQLAVIHGDTLCDAELHPL